MKLTIYNGSPRGPQGNTEILINYFMQGFDNSENTVSVNYLQETIRMREYVGKFQNADNILVAFPLYVDAMPGVVKEFFEALQDIKFYNENQRIGFLIHCGFPETAHLRPVQRYLKKLSRRLGIPYLGTIAKGGTEGLRVSPERVNKKLFTNMIKLGKSFAETREFDSQLLKSIAGNEKFPTAMIPLLRMLNKTGLFNIFWNKQLRKNKAFNRRFDAPYKEY